MENGDKELNQSEVTDVIEGKGDEVEIVSDIEVRLVSINRFLELDIVITHVHLLYFAIPVMPKGHHVQLFEVVDVESDSVLWVFIAASKHKENKERHEEEQKTQDCAEAKPSDEDFLAELLFEHLCDAGGSDNSEDNNADDRDDSFVRLNLQYSLNHVADVQSHEKQTRECPNYVKQADRKQSFVNRCSVHIKSQGPTQFHDAEEELDEGQDQGYQARILVAIRDEAFDAAVQ